MTLESELRQHSQEEEKTDFVLSPEGEERVRKTLAAWEEQHTREQIVSAALADKQAELAEEAAYIDMMLRITEMMDARKAAKKHSKELASTLQDLLAAGGMK